jgi:putative SOS response-associated peptidase YedK
VPATSLCEPTDQRGPKGKKIWTWFGLDDCRPLSAMAGIWCDWIGTRGTLKNPEEGRHRLYGFLTTAPNGIVKPVHSKVHAGELPKIVAGASRRMRRPRRGFCRHEHLEIAR